MNVTDITRVADEAKSAAVSAVNESLITTVREGERLANNTAGWLHRLAARLTAPSRPTSRRTAVIVGVAVAIVGVVLVRRMQRTRAGADDGNVVETLTATDHQSDHTPPARQVS